MLRISRRLLNSQVLKHHDVAVYSIFASREFTSNSNYHDDKIKEPRVPPPVRPTRVDSVFEDLAKRYVPNIEYETRKRNQRAATAINKKTHDFNIVEDSPNLNFRRLFAIVWPERVRLAIGMTATALSSLTALAFPTAVGQIIDMINDNSSPERVYNYVAGMGMIVFFGSVAVFVRSCQLSIVGERISRNLRKEVFHSILNHRIEFFDKNNTGRLVNRLSTDTVIVGTILTDNIARFLKALFSGLSCSYCLFAISPSLTLLSTCVIPIFVGTAGIYGNLRKLWTQNLLTALAKETQSSTETFLGIRTIQSYVREHTAFELYSKRVENSFVIAKNLALIEGAFLGGGFLFSQATLLGVLLLGAEQMSSGLLSVGSLTSFCMYTGYLFINVGQFSVALSEFVKALGASKRVFYVIDSSNAVKFEMKGVVLADNHKPTIKFENVHFSYSTRPESKVLDDVSFEIKPGEKVALTGPSGCGKSTIAMLLNRSYDVSEGRILYGDKNVIDLDAKWLRRQISEVSQNPVLFNITIADNIGLGRDELGRDHMTYFPNIKLAAQRANAHDFIAELENGYETHVGEAGLDFSGGQRQRIGIARCLLTHSKVMVCDEPTSALDAESEVKVIESLVDHNDCRTCLIITHDINVLRAVDKIIMLKDGRVVEIGSFNELSRSNGPFSKLVSLL